MLKEYGKKQEGSPKPGLPDRRETRAARGV